MQRQQLLSLKAAYIIKRQVRPLCGRTFEKETNEKGGEEWKH